MIQKDCIGSEDLRAWCLGWLPDERSDQILTHLNDCPRCADTVAEFDGTADSLLASLKDGLPNGGVQSKVLNDALQQVCQQVSPVEGRHPSTGKREPRVVERIRDYELKEQMGCGGMGTVYRAVHTRLDRVVAIKLLPVRRLLDNGAVARFEREMKAIGRLDHPAIVKATDAGEAHGTPFLVMEFVDGIDLSRLVRLVGPLEAADACEIIRQAAVALDYAHQQGFVHRDVKPSNLMLTRSGQIRILDLGLALFGAAGEAVDDLTTVGQLMGTLDYMAPEQADNSHRVDARADVYSLGAALFKLLTTRAPFDAPGRTTPLAKIKALATLDAPEVSEHHSDLPAELVEVVGRMLSRDPESRPETAAEVSDLLEPFATGHALASLAERGMQLANDEDQAVQQLPLAASSIQKHRGADDLPPRHADKHGRSFNWRTALVGACAAAVFLLAGIAIWIATDKGKLVIECGDTNVPITIRRGDEVYGDFELHQGANEFKLRSGRYEIVIPEQATHLKVDRQQVVLERGDRIIAKIERLGATASANKPPDPPKPPRPGEPTTEPRDISVNAQGESTIDGRTFTEWRRIVELEPSAQALIPAVEAMCALGRKEHPVETMTSIIGVSSRYTIWGEGAGSVPGLGELFLALVLETDRLDDPKATAVLADRIRQGSAKQRIAVLQLLFTMVEYTIGHEDTTYRPTVASESVIREAFIESWSEPLPRNERALINLILLSSANAPGAATDEPYIQWLWQIVDEPFDRYANGDTTDDILSALSALMKLTPDDKRIVERLFDELEGKIDRHQPFNTSIYTKLDKLGSRLAAYNDRLTSLLEETGQMSGACLGINNASPSYYGSSGSSSPPRPRWVFSHRICLVELLGSLGSDAASSAEVIRELIATVDAGDWPSSEEVDRRLDKIHQLRNYRRQSENFGHTSSGSYLRQQSVQQHEPRQFVESALHALYRITGQKPDMAALKNEIPPVE